MTANITTRELDNIKTMKIILMMLIIPKMRLIEIGIIIGIFEFCCDVFLNDNTK